MQYLSEVFKQFALTYACAERECVMVYKNSQSSSIKVLSINESNILNYSIYFEIKYTVIM